MNGQIYVFVFFLLFSLGKTQPKLSFDLGMSIYQPTLTGYDENDIFPSKNFINRNFLYTWSFYYEFFYNARLGMSTSTSFDSKNKISLDNASSADFQRRITYRFFPIETFFRWRPKIELNFTLSPIWGRSIISLETAPSQQVEDWNSFLSKFNDTADQMTDMGATDAMTSNWFGYSSMLGIRYYITSRMAIDFKSGFMNHRYDESKWKLRGEKVTGPKMKLDDLPVFMLKFLYGFR